MEGNRVCNEEGGWNVRDREGKIGCGGGRSTQWSVGDGGRRSG